LSHCCLTSPPTISSPRISRHCGAGMAPAASRDDEVVTKSPNDQRSYRFFRLTNGLCVLFIHDPEIYADGYPVTQTRP
jgi:hypothetical protein